MSGYRLAERVALGGRTTFGVPATAAMYAEVRDLAALPELFGYAMLREGEVLVLGGGSNLLFAGDPPGVVLGLAPRGVALLEDDGDTALVRAEAGLPWNDLVGWTLGRGLVGLENLVAIPGSCGAAPIQNIGAYGREVGEFVEAVEVFDRQALAFATLDRAACAFGYRDSAFKRTPGRWVVTALRLRLPRRAPLRTDYAGVCEELAALGVAPGEVRAVHVAEAIARIRARKLPDPAVLGNAGSFYKNPIVPEATALALRDAHPGLPVHPAGDGLCKLSAGWLIEAAGFKGVREGDAGVAPQHALVLVNHGRATGAQLLALAVRISEGVHARFGVWLEPEPLVIGGRFPPAPTSAAPPSLGSA